MTDRTRKKFFNCKYSRGYLYTEQKGFCTNRLAIKNLIALGTEFGHEGNTHWYRWGSLEFYVAIDKKDGEPLLPMQFPISYCLQCKEYEK
jgi:hypothetical protein